MLTMRKEILVPAVAVIGGGVGFALRRWGLSTGFEPDTGLPIPGAPANLALIALSVVMAVLLALLCLGCKRAFSGYGQAFQAQGNTLCATTGVISGFLLLGAGALMAAEPAMGGELVYTRLITAALALVAGICVVLTVRDNFRGLADGKYSFKLLMPAYAFCVWLIAAYQVRAGDPVRLDYVYELFAIITGLLGLYGAASFSFERGRSFLTALFSMLGVYFSLVTLADSHQLADMLLYAFTIVYLLTNTVTLLHNAARPELPAQGEHDTEGSSDA